MNFKKLLVPVLAALSALAVLFSPLSRKIGQEDNAPVMQAPDSGLEIHFIDVGQGDSTLILCDGEAMLIDAGENDQGTKVQSYLTAQGVDRLDYVIGTHPDSDHIGGLDVILYKFDCETVIMPEAAKDTATYRDVIDTMSHKRYQNTPPVPGDTWELGGADFTILSPSGSYESSNDNSVAILLTYGETSFLLTGDAQEQAEQDMLSSGLPLKADVYKAGHHGSSTSSTEDFLNAASPAYAVISCGEDNSYGHPHAEVLNRFRAMGLEVFRTDEQGSIIAYSDGQNITWSCSPSESWQSGSGAHVAGPSPSAAELREYICNVNTMKFHLPDCASAKAMKEENRLEVSALRDDLLAQGYEPCGGCKP